MIKVRAQLTAAVFMLGFCSSLQHACARDVTLDLSELDMNGHAKHQLPRPKDLPPDKVPHRRLTIHANDILLIQCPTARYPSNSFGWIEYHAAAVGSGCLLPVLRRQVPHTDYFQAREPGVQSVIVGLKQPGKESISPFCYVDVRVIPEPSKEAVPAGHEPDAAKTIRTYGGHYDNSRIKTWNSFSKRPSIDVKSNGKNAVQNYDWKSLPAK
jgi:hypothetical protein